MGIRRTIGRFGVKTAAFRLAHGVRVAVRSELRMLAYHRVIAPSHAYDSENVSADLENFDWQMRFMRKNYDVLSFAELAAAIDRDEVLPRRCALITFDDGFADNYFNAFPVLKELGMPALFSVVTSMVDQREMFWFDRAACLVQRSPSGERLECEAFVQQLTDTNRDVVTAGLLQFLKDQPDEVRRGHLDIIDAMLTELMPNEAELAPHYPLNWEQINLMSEAGMEFGSHTHSHPILAKLPDEESIDRELCTSRQIISHRTGKPCLVVAYPEGLDYAIDERVFRSAERAGYRFGLTSLRGMNRLPVASPYQIQRIQIHHSNDRTLFEAAVQFPELVV